MSEPRGAASEEVVGPLSVPPGLCSELPQKSELAALVQCYAKHCSHSQGWKQKALLQNTFFWGLPWWPTS